MYAMAPDLRIVVAMDDPELVKIVRPTTIVVEVDRTDPENGLPLAAARNAGAAAAIDHGAELLIFLDVDCLPDSRLLHFYQRAADRDRHGALYAGPVAYLPPVADDDHDQFDRLHTYPFHPARPAPAPGELRRGGDHRLFWSLSFAITASVWSRIGGFCERYDGYGAEDTDFAQMAHQAGVELVWVGGAAAFHQWHPSSSPPVQHLEDILRNGAIFAERWGSWPMEGWLQAFEDLELVHPDGRGGWVRSDRELITAASGPASRKGSPS